MGLSSRLSTGRWVPPSQWSSVRSTNEIERLREEFKRTIRTQTVLPSADTAAMLFWALLASGQISMRKVDGWQTLATKPIDQPIDLAACNDASNHRRSRRATFQPHSGRHPQPNPGIQTRTGADANRTAVVANLLWHSSSEIASKCSVAK